MITQCWRDRDAKNCVDGEMPFVVSTEDKNLIRNNIIEAIVHSPELIRYICSQMFAIAQISSWIVRTFVCINSLKRLLTLSNFFIMTSKVDNLTYRYGNKAVIISNGGNGSSN